MRPHRLCDVPGELEPLEQDGRNEVADVERGRGRIKADIARYNLLRRQSVEAGGIGRLVDIAACLEQAEERGLIFGH